MEAKLRPVKEWADFYKDFSVRPKWCPFPTDCQPVLNEFGNPEAQRGMCVGVDLHTHVEGSQNAPDCIRLCIKVPEDVLHFSCLMTLDEAARLGGGLSLLVGQGLYFLSGWKEQIEKMD